MRETLAALPTLNATEIRNALAYYDSHQEEIEADIAADAQSDLLPL